MPLLNSILLRKAAIARALLLIFAFSAWSLTAPANIALALLAALFLLDLPGHWGQLRREPALLLFLGVLLVTSLLALRATWLFPATAADQWPAVWAWSAPLLFIVPAWWLRRDPAQVWPLLGAALLGLAVGVLRKTDWSLTPQILAGLRYHFGYAALGLAFLASVMLVGLVLLRARITGVTIGGRVRPGLGWTLWLLGCGFLVIILVVTQSRGAALLLVVTGVLYGVFQGRARRWPARASAVLVIALAGTLLWATKERELDDWQQLRAGGQGAALSYTGPTAIRLNLYRVGLQTFAQAPLLGFGPGTSTTEFLVPQRQVPVSPYDLTHVPEASHLHSVALEVLVRFGLAGVLIALLLGWVLAGACRHLWHDDRAAADLRAFLALTGVMLLLFCLYDFRVMNLDLRFFCILYFGVLYSFKLDPAAPGQSAP